MGVEVVRWGNAISVSNLFLFLTFFTRVKVQKGRVRGQYGQMMKLRLASHI